MVRTSKVAVYTCVFGVAALFVVAFGWLFFKPVASTGWASIDEITNRIRRGENITVLVCIYAEWDTTTYRHFSWLDRDLEQIVKTTGVVPCRFRLDKSEERTSLDLLKLTFPNFDFPDSTGFGFVDSFSKKSEWYYTVDSDAEFARIVQGSQILKSKR